MDQVVAPLVYDEAAPDGLADLFRQRAAEELLHRYQWLVDHKDLEGLAGIVHPDVELTRQDGTRYGAGPFLDLYRRFAASDVVTSHHNAMNTSVRELPQGALGVRSTFLAITTHAGGEARFVWGRYDDEMVVHEDRWVYRAKRIAIGRTAFIDEGMLAPLHMDSFGRRPGESSSAVE